LKQKLIEEQMRLYSNSSSNDEQIKFFKDLNINLDKTNALMQSYRQQNATTRSDAFPFLLKDLKSRFEGGEITFEESLFMMTWAVEASMLL
jgi:hypothetical protein